MNVVRLLTVIFCSIIYLNGSVDIVELYRTGGLKAVEQEIQKKLGTKEYWDYYLKDKDVSNGYYESIDYVMICQKDMKNMEVYETKDQKKLFSSNVFTGKLNGDKKKEGDMRTPVGAYRLTSRLTKIDPFYGPVALTTNYPNIYDKAQGKTGHGIWIHGLPESEQRDDYTKGCIALENSKIKKLDKKINIDNSMLIISEEGFVESSKEDISLILTNIFKWKEAWTQGDINEYISFYNESFKRSNGQNYEKFRKYKQRIFNKKQKKYIKFSNINIVPYPNETNKKLYKVIMDEVYKTATYKFEGKKELYIQIEGGSFSILTES